MKNKRMLGSLLLLLTAMIWGTAFAFQRTGMEHIGPFSFGAARFALSAAAVGIPALIRERKRARAPSASEDGRERARRRDTLLGGLCCGAFLGTANMLQQAGLQTTTAGKAGFITALYILLVPLLELALFRKRYGARVWIAAALGAAGLYLLCVTESFALTRGDALVCLCALVFSGHILCCGHFSGRGDPIAISAIQFAIAALLPAVGALLFEKPSWAQIVSAAVPILYCGLISGAVGYTLQMIAQRWTDPAVASLLMSLEAVFAVIGGVLILSEHMSGRETLGCAVMFAAIVLVQLPAGGGIRKRGKSI
ncbi:MAG: DMT family transporter [Oscillospiraceae bacterium]|nr:DMT family transporter [Oscillospiraceae bacterium]